MDSPTWILPSRQRQKSAWYALICNLAARCWSNITVSRASSSLAVQHCIELYAPYGHVCVSFFLHTSSVATQCLLYLQFHKQRDQTWRLCLLVLGARFAVACYSRTLPRFCTLLEEWCNCSYWKCLQVSLDVPQEVHMWEDFADCSKAIQDGGKPEKHWPEIAMLTQKVVCAVEQSASDGCKTKKIQW